MRRDIVDSRSTAAANAVTSATADHDVSPLRLRRRQSPEQPAGDGGDDGGDDAGRDDVSHEPPAVSLVGPAVSLVGLFRKCLGPVRLELLTGSTTAPVVRWHASTILMRTGRSKTA